MLFRFAKMFSKTIFVNLQWVITDMLIIIDPKQIKKTFFPTDSEHEKIRKFNRQYYERYLLNITETGLFIRNVRMWLIVSAENCFPIKRYNLLKKA